jgi:hypothetical protein
MLSPLAIGLTAAVVGQMAQMLFEAYHSRVQMQSLALGAALLTATLAMSRESLTARAQTGTAETPISVWPRPGRSLAT